MTKQNKVTQKKELLAIMTAIVWTEVRERLFDPEKDIELSVEIAKKILEKVEE